jgi:hypothetical protein
MDHSAAPPDLDALARDWITLWQSELAAIAVDREAQESWQAILALWAGIAGAMLNAAPRGPAHERADRRAGAAAPAGAAAASAAPDARDAEIERLTRHVAELELRLAEVERGVRRGGGGHRRGTQGSEPRRQRR